MVEPLELARDLEDMIVAQGEPFGSTSIYAQYRVYKLAREHGVTVTLDGQGADELLAGYHGYPGQRLHSLLDHGSWCQAVGFLRQWSRWPGRTLARGLKGIADEFADAPASWRHAPTCRASRVDRTGWMRARCASAACVLGFPGRSPLNLPCAGGA